MTQLAADVTLDCTGQICPMPILKLSKAITGSQPGQIIELIATDSGSKDDVPAFCARTNNTLLSTREDGGRFIFYVRKGL
jgi:tRNA 2-thiouridine synthesizing protein A